MMKETDIVYLKLLELESGTVRDVATELDYSLLAVRQALEVLRDKGEVVCEYGIWSTLDIKNSTEQKNKQAPRRTLTLPLKEKKYIQKESSITRSDNLRLKDLLAIDLLKIAENSSSDIETLSSICEELRQRKSSAAESALKKVQSLIMLVEDRSKNSEKENNNLKVEEREADIELVMDVNVFQTANYNDDISSEISTEVKRIELNKRVFNFSFQELELDSVLYFFKANHIGFEVVLNTNHSFISAIENNGANLEIYKVIAAMVHVESLAETKKEEKILSRFRNHLGEELMAGSNE